RWPAYRGPPPRAGHRRRRAAAGRRAGRLLADGTQPRRLDAGQLRRGAGLRVRQLRDGAGGLAARLSAGGWHRRLPMAQAVDLTLRSYAPQTLRHSHGHHQIVLPLAGVLEMEVGGKGGQVAGCQAALIAAGSDHSCEAAGENRFVVLDWMGDDADDGEIARLSDVAERRPFLAYDAGLHHLVS